MKKGAEKLLGRPIVAGTTVQPKGILGAAVIGQVGGALGGALGSVAGDAIADHRGGEPSPIGKGFGKIGFLAVTADEIILLKAKQGLLKPKVTEVLATVPRSALAAITLGGGIAAPLQLTFHDGTAWEFSVPKVHQKGAKAVAAALGGAA